jgi:hypothetical protein
MKVPSTKFQGNPSVEATLMHVDGRTDGWMDGWMDGHDEAYRLVSRMCDVPKMTSNSN